MINLLFIPVGVASGRCGAGTTWSLSRGFSFYHMTNKYSVDTVLYFLYENAIHFSKPAAISINRGGVFYRFGESVRIERAEGDVFESAADLLTKIASVPPINYDVIDYPF